MTTNFEIPSQHKAVIYDAPGTISTKTVMVDTPEPGLGQVLIKLTHSGVCHSDLSIMLNSWKALPFPIPKGQIGGHEGVGQIVKFGPGCERSELKLGDRVGVKWIASVCRSCLPCLAGSDGICIKQTNSGYFTPGTFQQYVLGSVDYVTPIPSNLSSDIAAPILCAGITVYAALKRTNARPGDFVIISGAGGGLGQIATQLGSRGLGYRVIGIDHPSKADFIKDSGAEAFVDITAFPRDDQGAAITEHVKSLTGDLGAHAAVICTANNRAYADALRMLRFNGVLVCVGIPEGEETPIATASPAPLIFKQLEIKGSVVGNGRDALEVLDFAERGILNAQPRIGKMEDLNSIFEEMRSGRVTGRIVLDLS